MGKIRARKTTPSSTTTSSGGGGGWSSLPWRPLGVTLGETGNNESNSRPKSKRDDNYADAADTDDDAPPPPPFDPNDVGYNHYDDPGKANWDDLYGAGPDDGADVKKKKKRQKKHHEDVAMMEGADDPGILLGLEVLDGNSYEVQRLTTTTTKVVPRDAVPEDEDVRRSGGGKKGGAGAKKRRREDGNVEGIDAAADDDAADDDNGKDGGENSSNDGGEDDKEDLEAMQREIKRLKRKAKRKEAKIRKRKRKKLEQQKKATAAAAAEDDENDEGGGGGDGDGKIGGASKLHAQPQKGGTGPNNDKNTNTNTKKKGEKKGKKVHSSSSAAAPHPIPTSTQITTLQTTWSITTGGVLLHRQICTSLLAQNFHFPTPIQSATLPAAILGRRNVVGAAPTGSGKTLSYVLPILQGMLERFGEEEEEEDEEEPPRQQQLPLTALILCPTRELALQVTAEIRKLVSPGGRNEETKKKKQPLINVGTIVGGLAEQKQRRILDVVRPPILVATPGRLWEMISSENHSHLTNLSQLRYLVVDEADRMVRQGSFPQLTQIFGAINRSNPPLMANGDNDGDDGGEGDDDGDEDEDGDRLRALHGVPGEARVAMLDDTLLRLMERQEPRQDDDADDDDDDDDDNDDAADDEVPQHDDEDDARPEPQEMDDDEYEEQLRVLEEERRRGDGSDDDDDVDGGSDDSDDGLTEPVHRQTFIYSATLTLPPSSHRLIKDGKAAEEPVLPRKGKKKGTKTKKKGAPTVEGAIAEILEKAGARGQTKVVDLTLDRNAAATSASGGKIGTSSNGNAGKDAPSSKVGAASSSFPTTKLPPGLTLHEVKCTQKHKDMHLYAYLTTTKQGSSGPALVFCNSIAAVRRVGETLRVLGLPVRTIHAQMAQKARMSALESIRQPNSRPIVVATDVAARGLDITSVATVVHYDAARAIDTFIHRAGRTARGMGEKAVGASISLVSPSEEKAHRAICEAVCGPSSSGFDPVHIDGRLLSAAQERTALATRIVSCEEVESKASKKNKWFIEAAEDAGLDLDEDLLDGGLVDGDNRDRQRFSEARKAKTQLRELLAIPMRTQQFGKFLSGAGLSAALKAENDVTPYVVQDVGGSRKRSKKRKGRRG